MGIGLAVGLTAVGIDLAWGIIVIWLSIYFVLSLRTALNRGWLKVITASFFTFLVYITSIIIVSTLFFIIFIIQG